MRAGLSALVAVWAWGTVGVVAALAQPAQGDVFATQGDYDRYAVGGAHRWYDSHAEDVKQRSSGCLALLDEAKVYQDRALALYEQARQPGNRNASALVRQANAQIARRTQTLESFRDCVNQAMRAPRPDGDLFATTDRPKGLKRSRVPDPKPPDPITPPPARPPRPASPPPRPPPPPPLPKPLPIRPRPPPGPPPPPTTMLDQAIDDCFRGKDALYRSPDWDRAFTLSQRRLQVGGDYPQAFRIAARASEHALWLDEQAYGAWADRELMLDYLAGWVTHCLYDQGAVPYADPRPAYQTWMKRRYAPSAQISARLAERNGSFAFGFGSYPLPPFFDREPRNR